MDTFKPFGDLVSENIAKMKRLVKDADRNSGFDFYKVDIPSDLMWDHYLASFPEGSNPIYRERTVHDCSCCRHFIKQMGNLVVVYMIEDKPQIITVWDGADKLDSPYSVVGQAMASLVRGHAIRNIARTNQTSYGTPYSIEHLENGKTHRWHHFHIDTTGTKMKVRSGDDVGPALSRAQAQHDVLARGVSEITADALGTVLNLISEDNLYRGRENMDALLNFQTIQYVFRGVNDPQAYDLFAWLFRTSRGAQIKNTVIGTLLIDLSQGMDTEAAVRAYELKVAPENYRRPKSLITKKQIEQAVNTIDKLGLRDAMERRHARLEDVNVQDILWVDPDARTKMKGTGDELMDSLLGSGATKGRIDSTGLPTMKASDWDGSETFTHEDLFLELLPNIKRMAFFMQGTHMTRLMSITTEKTPDSGNLFQWDNPFAWSYSGNLTDSSITQRVKQAGGKTASEGSKLRVSLGWFNGDDLDLHCKMPDGQKIYFGNKYAADTSNRRSMFRNGEQILDVDMNAGGPRNSKDPVENLTWSTPMDGTYEISVNNYARRDSSNIGFQMEIENAGRILTYEYTKGLNTGDTVMCFRIKVQNETITDIQVVGDLMPTGETSQDVWGIQTNSLVPVTTILHSPNHWGNQEKGMRHIFFMLQGLENPEPVRGFYNEFLSSSLREHRKVFEILGDRSKAQPVSAQEQLSGVGFSAGQRQNQGEADALLLAEMRDGSRRRLRFML